MHGQTVICIGIYEAKQTFFNDHQTDIVYDIAQTFIIEMT